ncbi:MAG: ATP-dependent DNA helicase [Gemmatimonadaceae bacterium]|nr:ATP-dependent DNA helicase [Gemmatimonadaceae bacterium]
MACGTALKFDTDDFLLHGANNLVREIRPGQVLMGQLTERVLANKSFATVEGPVGIGKSFAYAIPSILSGKRVVISTAKKQLQHQLAQKDLPFLAERLEKPVTIALLKGKSNYGCAMKASDLKPEDEATFRAWLASSKMGDLSDWPGRKPFYWSDVTAEDCVGGHRCKFSKDCGYWKSKEQLKSAQIVVANHHVVAWDLRFGPKKLLGNYDCLIIDEAHQAVSAFRGAYSKQATPYSVKRIIRGVDKAGLDTKLVKPLEMAWDAMFAHIKNLDGEVPANPFEAHGEISQEILATLRAQVKKEMADHGGGDDVDPDDFDYAEKMRSRKPNLHQDYVTKLEMLGRSIDRPLEALAEIKDPGDNIVVYVNTTDKKAKIVNAAPINIGPMVGPKLRQLDTVIVTSATIAVNGDFRDIRNQLGLDMNVTVNDEDGAPVTLEKKEVEELVLETPFDYRRQALLYMPQHMPMPVSRSGTYPPTPERIKYIEAVSTECKKLIRSSDGNAFILFTATNDMRDVHAALLEEGLDNPLIMQEDDAESTFKAFMATPKSVILGLKSFWEGVDVVGDKLRLVIITKLPFPQVNDPVIRARSRTVKNEGIARGLSESTAESNVFKAVQVPIMLTDLRQGAGRLIRSKEDKGVLAILDPRIWTGSGKKLPIIGQRAPGGYGAQAADSVGFSNKTADFGLVDKFLRMLCQEEVARGAKNKTST